MTFAHSKKYTLQERLKAADSLARELSEHLRQAYIPKLNALRSVTKKLDVAEVSDRQVFDRGVDVLEAEDFTAGLHDQLHEHLMNIIKQCEDELMGVNLKETPVDRPDLDFEDLV